MNMKKRQSGFTLVEIAIVLVIIGLILGGVLKGQEMIENAKFKNFVKEVESYRAAYHTFQDKYGSYPGDMTRANARRLLNNRATGGNGNGRIDGGFCDRNNEEACLAWSHLRYAKLISGDPTVRNQNARPNHAYGGPVSSISTGNWANSVDETKLLLQTVPGDVALRLDSEYDDGNPTTGDIARYGGSGRTWDTTRTHSVFIAM